VHVYNSDNPVTVWMSSFVTITDSVWSRTSRRGQFDCHHAVNVTWSQDVLVSNWRVNMRCVHDISGYAWNNGVVFSNGTGTDMNLDHHRLFPFATLWSNLNIGTGTRVWLSGGEPWWGSFSAAYTTYYNIRGTRPITVSPASNNGPMGNWLNIQWGPNDRWDAVSAASQGWYREGTVSDDRPAWPTDLQQAMRVTRQQRFSQLGREAASVSRPLQQSQQSTSTNGTSSPPPR